MKYNGNNILNEIVDTVQKLVSFKTTPSNFEQFDKAVKFIEKYFEGSSINIEKHYFNEFPALYISTNSSKHSSIMMQAHVDVVDGMDNQFKPFIRDGKMYGRGTSDMKGFVAIAMKLLKEFKQYSHNSSLSLLLTFDEEIGSENGTKKMVELGYTGDLIINGDAGYNYSVIYGEKGILKVKLKVEANPGRHPYSWDGKNAFELLDEDYNKIISLFPGKDIATEEDNWYTTYSIYDFNIENNEQYPSHLAEAKMNFYFTEDMTTEEFLERIKHEIRYCEIEKIMGSERVFIDPKNKYIRLMHEIMSKNFQKEIAIRTENGSSDARFYADKGIPIVILKPVGEDHHGENECLYVDLLLPLFNSLKEFILINNERVMNNTFSEVENVN